MQKFVGPENEHGLDEENSGETDESDNLWKLTSISKEEFQKWQNERERYEEVLEYIKEVEEILNLIKPFPRSRSESNEAIKAFPSSDLVRLSSQSEPSSNDLNHLEKIIKLVEQLKELQNSNSKFSGGKDCHRNLRRLRDHKKRLMYEELILKSEGKNQGAICSENEAEAIEYRHRRSKSASNETSQREKRKSNHFTQNLNENKLKVSKWTKVKEAFHWERASPSTVSKSGKKEVFPAGKLFVDDVRESFFERGDTGHKYFLEDGSLTDFDGLELPSPPPTPPLLEQLRLRFPLQNDNYLSVPPPQDLPSSSSSDKVDEFLLHDISNDSLT